MFKLQAGIKALTVSGVYHNYTVVEQYILEAKKKREILIGWMEGVSLAYAPLGNSWF